MPDNLKQIHRQSIRLKEYDYSSPGAYFLTVVTYQRGSLFGEVVDGEMRMNHYGQIVEASWRWLAEQYPYIENDIFVVMPNHFHGILQIIELKDDGRGGSRATQKRLHNARPYRKRQNKTFGTINRCI